MQVCPRCQDYDQNSEFHALQTISPEIARLANIYALSKAQTETENFIDYYMMHYRIEFTKQLECKKPSAKFSYNSILDIKYKGHENRCIVCTKDDTVQLDIFNDTLGFCFHVNPYDPDCEKCIKKLNITESTHKTTK